MWTVLVHALSVKRMATRPSYKPGVDAFAQSIGINPSVNAPSIYQFMSADNDTKQIAPNNCISLDTALMTFL